MIKSPFYIINEFISPQMCEDIIDVCNFTVPDTNANDDVVKTSKTSDSAEMVIFQRLLSVIPDIEAYYQLKYKGTDRIQFEWFPTNSEGGFICENSTFLRGKWLRTKQTDLTAILFLSDYQEQLPFEEEFEVYGGKLEFAQHKFGFNPQRGTLVVFPSDPHFINNTSRVLVGDLFQARIHITASVPYIYNPQLFPGNYTSWFSPLLNA